MKAVILPRTRVLTASIASLLAGAGISHAAVATWDDGAGTQDWNNAVNWTGDVFPTGNFPDGIATINTATGLFPIISADSAFTPSDLFVGDGGGNSGRLDQTAGVASNGNGNWMFVGVNGGTGTYNLADTSTTGGTLTGFGMGSGSMTVGNTGTGGRLYIGGRDSGGAGNGTVNVNTSGSLIIRNDLNIGQSGGTGVMNVDAGTIATGGWNFIGGNQGSGGSNGTLNMNGGMLTNTGRTYVGQSNAGVGCTGKLQLTGSGKYLNVNNELFIIGEGAGSHGEVIVNGANAQLLSEGEMWIGQDGGNGSVTVSAGTVSVGNWLAVGRAGGTGVLTISGTGLVQKTDTDGSLEITNAGSTTASGIVNLDGGTLRVNNIASSGGTGSTARFFFNGGTLKPTVDNGNFLSGNVVPIVKSGGVVIDTSGFNISINPALTADAVSTGGGLTKNGNGTLTLGGGSTFTGNVSVNAGTLAGAFSIGGNPTTTAFGDATIAGRTITVATNATLRLTANDVFGNQAAIAANLPALIINGTLNTTRYNQIGALTLNGATLSNANTTDSGNFQNFQFLGDVTVTGSIPSFITTTGVANFNANHLATATTFNVADVTGNANSDLVASAPFRDQSGNYGLAPGSLIKTGAGTMELSGASVYTGATTVSNGTLLLSGSGAINSSSGITVNGAGAKLVQNSLFNVTAPVTLTSGTVDGVGNIGTINVANLATNTVANGNGVPGAVLSIDSLTFAGAGKVSVLLNSISAGIAANALTASGAAGAITIDASNTLWSNGTTYDLISYFTLNGTLANFSKGNIVGLGARQTATLGNSGFAITLSITGDLPVWTGAGNGIWTTATQTPKNWKLQTGGTTTDFLTNDVVLFDDTATGTTVSIGQNVSPVSTTFDNTTKTYTVTSAGGFGITNGTLTKNGNGVLNLGGTHTYTGATLLNAGMINLTGSLGNTAVTIASGATLLVQAANALSQNTVTVNGTYGQTVNNALSGSAAIVFNNGATLANANSHSGGTTITNGALNLAHPGALGTGPLIIAGGTLDNTSGAAMTLANANPVRLLADLNFTGSNALNLGTGAVTLGSDAATQTINVTAGNTLTFGGPLTAGTGGTAGFKTLNLTGNNVAFTGSVTTGVASGLVLNSSVTGTLTLSGTASNFTTLNLNGGASSVVEIGAGNLSVANGGGSVLQSTTGGIINATGGGTLIIGSANGDMGTAGGTTLTVNAPLAGSNAVDFYNANGGAGLGTIILAAVNTTTGAINVENTRVVLPTGGSITTLGQVTVGTVGGAPAALEVNGGTLNANKGNSPGILVGSANGADATMTITGGVVNAPNELWIGNSPGAIGTVTQSAGATTVGNWLAVGRDRANGTLNLSGGTITKTGNAGNYIIIGSLGGTGVVNQTGGAFDATAGGIRLGENTGNTPSLNSIWDMRGGTSTVTGEINVGWVSSQATWNVAGTSVVTASGRLIVGAGINDATINVGPIVNGAPVGTVNISGGTVTFNGGDSRIGGDSVTTGTNSNATATGIVNVTGGTLNFGANLQIGGYGQGTMTVSGTGVVNATNGFPSVGRFPGSNGVLNVNGGTFNNTAPTSFIIGEEGTGTLNLNGGLVDVSDLRVGHTATANGTINLNGGTLSLSTIQKTVPGSAAKFKFNGGVIRAEALSFDLFTGFDASSLSVENGGAKIDTNGNSVTISQGLAPGAGSTGGLTKLGNGTLILSGGSTYTGPTSVEAGSLLLMGSLSGTASITVKSGATFDVGSVFGGFLLTNGQTLRGGGTVSGNVSLDVGSKLAPGESAGTLTFDSTLDLTTAVIPVNSGTLQFELGSMAGSDKVVFTGAGFLNIGDGVLGFGDFAFSAIGGFGSGTYTLFDSSSPIFGSLDANSANLTGSLGGGFSGTLSIADSGNDLVLTVVPEPGSALLLLGGMATMVGLVRNRRSRAETKASKNR